MDETAPAPGVAEHLAPGWRFPDHLAAELAKLRADFPADQVGKLPRTTCRACSDSKFGACEKHTKAQCPECHQWMTPRHTHLDFVGHADVTNRLLEVDPLWSWEPIADPGSLGYPVVNGGLWIYLTVCGVTRPGFGDAQGKSGPNAVKELIGDAIRNAAMRFGVGLRLWAKGDRQYLADGGAAADAESVALVDQERIRNERRRHQDQAAEQPRPPAVERAAQDRAAEAPDVPPGPRQSDPEAIQDVEHAIDTATAKTLRAAWEVLRVRCLAGRITKPDEMKLRARWEARRDAVIPARSNGAAAPAEPVGAPA